MAFTYLILNLTVIAVVILCFAKYIRKPDRAVLIMTASLLVLTLIFDNLIIAAGIVGYDSAKLVGIYIGIAPIEDFFYTVLAALIIPTLWKLFSPSRTSTKKEQNV